MRNRPASRHRRRPIVVTTATLRLGIVFLLLLCAAGASANGVAASGCNSLGTSINLAPAAEENAVGTTHSVTATVTELCQPKSGVTVSFTVTGANPQTGSAVTNGSGEATLSYKGKKAGTDNITSSFKTLGTTETSNEVTKVWTTPTVKSTKSCNSVTYTFSGFPNAPNNTVQEWVQVDGKVVYKGTFIFNGPSGSNTVSVSVPPGHHAITANAKWNTNGVTGEKDMPKPGGITCHVFVGYADSSHFEQNAHPTPWQGDPGVIFEGCGYGGTDTCPMSEGEDVYD